MPKFLTMAEAQDAWAADEAMLEAHGIYMTGVRSYLPAGAGIDLDMAMDALPTLATAPSAGIPSMLTTFIDPDVIEIVFAPTKAAKIAGEVRKGTWIDETMMFPVVEQTGEVSSYGDHNNNGRSGANAIYVSRQSYLFQTFKEFGEREMERAGRARLQWQSQIEKAAASVLNRFSNLSYFFGVQGLANYGLLNDPSLAAALTPAVKAAGGTGWFTAGGAPNATANEVYNDILSMVTSLVSQTAGLIDVETPMTLAMAPGSEVATKFVNSFGLVVGDILRKELPSLKIETAVQYGALSATNPQGVRGGNMLQLIANQVEGQQVVYCAYNEKSRSHPMIRQESSFRQKQTAGTWGTVIRMPLGICSMIGI